MKTAILRATFRISAGLCAVAATASLQAGCDARHVLGAIDGGPPAQPDGDGTLPDGATVLPDGATVLPDGGDNRDGAVLTPVQSWTGYIENYKFKSGSDVVRIAFAFDSAGNLTGTVTLGSGTPPPPATDPNVGYPADLLGPIPPAGIDTASRYIAEGFAYSMRAGTLTGGRLRFGVGTRELWTGWCALQTPAPAQGQCDEPVCKSLCLPNWGSMSSTNGCALRNPATDQYEPVDCGKLALCSAFGVCICDPSGCTVLDEGTPMKFDVAITNDLASGSVTGQLGDHNVHFTKDP